MENESNYSKTEKSTTVEKYYPQLLSRRGELIAWISTVLVIVAWLIFSFIGRDVPTAVRFLTIFLSFSALAMSLGNWMDRHTEIVINENGISFTNGVRNANIHWKKIKKIEVIPSKWGKKVRVIGETAHFDYRTLGEVEVGGEVKGRLGFTDGDKILRIMLNNSGLKKMRDSNTGYYYVRE